MTETLLNVNQAAEELGCHPNTIRSWISEGRIANTVKSNGRLLFTRADLNAAAGKASAERDAEVKAGKDAIEARKADVLRKHQIAAYEESLAGKERQAHLAECRGNGFASEREIQKRMDAGKERRHALAAAAYELHTHSAENDSGTDPKGVAFRRSIANMTIPEAKLEDAARTMGLLPKAHTRSAPAERLKTVGGSPSKGPKADAKKMVKRSDPKEFRSLAHAREEYEKLVGQIDQQPGAK